MNKSKGKRFAEALRDFLASEAVYIVDSKGGDVVDDSFLKYMSGYLYSSAKSLVKEGLDKEKQEK